MNSYISIIPIIGALLCTGLGLFTLSRDHRSPVNIGFTLGMLSLSVMLAGYAAVALYLGSSTDAALSGARLSLVGQALIPPSWLLFSLAFGKSNYLDLFRKFRVVIILIFTASVFFAATAALGLLVTRPGGSLFDDAYALPLTSWGKYFYVYMLISLVFNLIHLENTLRSSSGVKRWHVKYIILGVGSIHAFLIYQASHALLFSSMDMKVVPVTSAVVLISTAMTGLFIVRQRLLNVDIFISRYVVYNSLTVALVGLYLLAVGLAAEGIRYFNLPYEYFLTTLFVFLAVLTLLVVFFNATLRRKLKLFVNRHFYRHKYEFRDKWMETTERISPLTSDEEVVGTLSEMISETMTSKPVHLWLFNRISGDYRAAGPNRPAGHRVIGPDHNLVDLARDCSGPFHIEEPVTADGRRLPCPDEAKKIAAETGTVLCAPMVAGADVVGFVLLGPDLSGEPYRNDDFELLKAITTQAAMQVKNIRMAGELMDAKEVEAFSNMTSFIMHDIKNLTNSLSLISQNARHNMDNPEFREDAIKTVDTTVSRMKGLIERLNTLPRKVELNKADTDIRELLDKTLNKIKLFEKNGINLTMDVGAVPMTSVDPEAMEMVLFNIITNACEAMENGGRINICAALEDHHVDISIEDDGPGINRRFIEDGLFRPFRSTKKKGFGVGLYQCKTVVEAHGGSIGVESAEGQGTTFTIRLPLRDAEGPR